MATKYAAILRCIHATCQQSRIVVGATCDYGTGGAERLCTRRLPYFNLGATVLPDDSATGIVARFSEAPARSASFMSEVVLDREPFDLGAGLEVLTARGLMLRAELKHSIGDDCQSTAGGLHLSRDI